jgi:NAD+ synthase (glutamine-hydrolysing)
LRDYFFKAGFKKAVVGISGGIDSALTACLGVDALGRENVVGVFMPSPFTSEESKKYAFELAENLGIELLVYPIDELFNTYRRLF